MEINSKKKIQKIKNTMDGNIRTPLLNFIPSRSKSGLILFYENHITSRLRGNSQPSSTVMTCKTTVRKKISQTMKDKLVQISNLWAFKNTRGNRKKGEVVGEQIF